MNETIRVMFERKFEAGKAVIHRYMKWVNSIIYYYRRSKRRIMLDFLAASYYICRPYVIASARGISPSLTDYSDYRCIQQCSVFHSTGIPRLHAQCIIKYCFMCIKMEQHGSYLYLYISVIWVTRSINSWFTRPNFPRSIVLLDYFLFVGCA